MKGRELRAEARISIRERASLNTGEAWFPCVVQDISDSGFLILCNKAISAGQVLEFRCELFSGKTLNCKIKIRHITASGMGTKIVEIDNRGTSLIQLYLQEQYSLKLSNRKS